MRILELAATWLLELAELFFFAKVIFFQRIIYKKTKIFMAVSVMIVFFCGAVCFLEEEAVILLTAAILLFLILLEGRKWHCFAVFWTVYWLVNKMNYLISVLLSVSNGRSCYIYLDEYPEIYIRSLCSLLVIFFMGIFMKRLEGFIRSLTDYFYGMAAFGGGCFFFFIMPAISFGRQDSSMALQNLIVMGSEISELLFYTALLAFFAADKKRFNYQRETCLKEEVLQATKNYCKEILENGREVRKIRHDMKHHITVMEYLMQEQKYQELAEYLTDMDEEMGKVLRAKKWTGNEILDAILSAYMQKEPEISFQVEGDFSKVDIRDYDLCVIFSNAVTNAIEACKCLEKQEKIVEIYLKKIGDSDILIIRNPVEWEIDVRGLGNGTTKKDRKNHGYGIARIRETAEKYQGSVVFEVKEHKFQIAVILMEKVKL